MIRVTTTAICVLSVVTSARADILGHFRQTGANIASINSSVGNFDTWVFEAKSVSGSIPAKNYDSLSLNFKSAAITPFINNVDNPRAFKTKAADGSIALSGPVENRFPETFFAIPAGTSELAIQIVDADHQLKAVFTTNPSRALISNAGERSILAMFSVPVGALFTFGAISIDGYAVSAGGPPDAIYLFPNPFEPLLPEPSTFVSVSVLVGVWFGAIRRR